MREIQDVPNRSGWGVTLVGLRVEAAVPVMPAGTGTRSEQPAAEVPWGTWQPHPAAQAQPCPGAGVREPVCVWVRVSVRTCRALPPRCRAPAPMVLAQSICGPGHRAMWSHWWDGWHVPGTGVTLTLQTGDTLGRVVRAPLRGHQGISWCPGWPFGTVGVSDGP